MKAYRIKFGSCLAEWIFSEHFEQKFIMYWLSVDMVERIVEGSDCNLF